MSGSNKNSQSKLHKFSDRRIIRAMKTAPFQMARKRLANWVRNRSEGPELLQWAVYIIIFAVIVFFILNHSPDLPNWRFFGTVISLTLVFVLNILWQEGYHVLPANLHRVSQWLFLLSSSALILAAIWMGHLIDTIYLIFMVCAQAAVILGVWPMGLVFSILNIIAWMVLLKAMGLTNSDIFSVGLSLSVGMLFVLLVATLLVRYSEQTQRAERLLRELQAANDQLQAARQKEKDLAIAEERVRLAREIHDGLGHHLTVLSIQLQAASKLVGLNPQGAADAIQLCRGEAQAALEEVRYSVGMMRQAPAESQPLPVALVNLVREFEQGTGLHTSFEQVGEAIELSTFVRQTLYRTVQESLTNAQKHGKDVQHIWVRLEYAPEATHLTVQNDGQAKEASSAEPPGFGLAGLTERVSQLGGVIKSGPDPSGGFKVEVNIPLQEVVRDPGSAG
jgi:signal transduction histidine kinase